MLAWLISLYLSIWELQNVSSSWNIHESGTDLRSEWLWLLNAKIKPVYLLVCMTVAAKFKEIPSHSCRVCREIKNITSVILFSPFHLNHKKRFNSIKNIKKKKEKKEKITTWSKQTIKPLRSTKINKLC